MGMYGQSLLETLKFSFLFCFNKISNPTTIWAFKERTRPKSANQGPLKISRRGSEPMNGRALGLRN